MTFECINNLETNILQCDLPFISTQVVDGENIYINQVWTGADVFVCLFLFIFLIIKITEIFFNFFLPKMIKIKTKK